MRPKAGKGLESQFGDVEKGEGTPVIEDYFKHGHHEVCTAISFFLQGIMRSFIRYAAMQSNMDGRRSVGTYCPSTSADVMIVTSIKTVLSSEDVQARTHEGKNICGKVDDRQGAETRQQILKQIKELQLELWWLPPNQVLVRLYS